MHQISNGITCRLLKDQSFVAGYMTHYKHNRTQNPQKSQVRLIVRNSPLVYIISTCMKTMSGLLFTWVPHE